jgi:hypothetical protein
MECLMVTREEAVQQTIALIEQFLHKNADGEELGAPEMLNRISRSLEHAQAVRDRSSAAEGFSIPQELCLRYRRCLEQLRDGLAELEITLSDERTRLLDEQSHLSRTREWHALLGRTQ